MKLVLKRFFRGDSYTIGKLYVDGVYFCDTLEDKDRGLKSSMPLDVIKRIKVKHQTAIPTGCYKVTLDVISPKYSKSDFYMKVCNGKVPRLINVVGFDGILIHSGNTADDTSGCILVGENGVKKRVINSRETFKRLYNMIKDESNIYIEII